MNLYQQLVNAYRHLARRPQPAWLEAFGVRSLDDLVAVIRNDRPDPAGSDRHLRALLDIARRDRDALTVALYSLAPKLRIRLSRAHTDEYRHDALTDLALVLVGSPIDGPRLAARLVNRAHNRAYKAARSIHHRGTVNTITITPTDPERVARHLDTNEDLATTVARRVDLARFAHDVRINLLSGQLSERAWIAYREHRLRRALLDGPACSAYQRTTASRVAHKLEPLARFNLQTA